MDGKKAGVLALPESLFGVKWNSDLVHQVTVAEMANIRNSVAHTKGRGDVRGGGKKPWQQKGTGRARAGSSRSPIWKGGGVSHGPKSEKVFEQKINKKMKAKALATVLSKKLNDGEILFIDAMTFSVPKTAKAKETLTHLAKIEGFDRLTTKKTNAALIGFPTNDTHAKKSFRNFGNVTVSEVRNWTAGSLLKAKYVIMVSPTDSLKTLAARMGEEVSKAKVPSPKKRAPVPAKTAAKTVKKAVSKTAK